MKESIAPWQRRPQKLNCCLYWKLLMKIQSSLTKRERDCLVSFTVLIQVFLCNILETELIICVCDFKYVLLCILQHCKHWYICKSFILMYLIKLFCWNRWNLCSYYQDQGYPWPYRPKVSISLLSLVKDNSIHCICTSITVTKTGDASPCALLFEVNFKLNCS